MITDSKDHITICPTPDNVAEAPLDVPFGYENVSPSDFAQGNTAIGNQVSQSVAWGRDKRKKNAIINGHITNGSEEAVEKALRWLVSVQQRDGGWNFDMAQSHPAVTNHGTATRARCGATAMALLPFLGAGHTHKEGKYAKVIYRGLEFLMANTNKEYTKGNDVSWFEADGSMYSHGLVTMPSAKRTA